MDQLSSKGTIRSDQLHLRESGGRLQATSVKNLNLRKPKKLVDYQLKKAVKLSIEFDQASFSRNSLESFHMQLSSDYFDNVNYECQMDELFEERLNLPGYTRPKRFNLVIGLKKVYGSSEQVFGVKRCKIPVRDEWTHIVIINPNTEPWKEVLVRVKIF